MARFVRIFQTFHATFGALGGVAPESPPPHGILAANSVFIVGAGGVFITSAE